jgi:ADP-dependent NAD(P)H-hydrate dehydratase
MMLINPQSIRSLFVRQNDSHKYHFGRVLVIGGSASMAGAPVLAGRAALRSGAGVVELCVPECVATVAASFDPCLITHHFASDTSGCFTAACLDDLYALAMRADVVVCGPGMGRAEGVMAIVKKLWQEMPRPIIFDADGLFALSKMTDQELALHAGPRIITPHAGEMQRLLDRSEMPANLSAENARAQLENTAFAFAKRHSVIVALKGHQTLITDGAISVNNSTGNPGMATAGSGDVLSGVIAALVGQAMPALEATQIAVWAHGMAGDLAAETLTQLSVTASDMIDFLPRAWQKIRLEILRE